MLRIIFLVMLAVALVAPWQAPARAEAISENLVLYLDARDVDGAGTAAANATGTLWKDLSGATEHDGTLSGTAWDTAGVGDGTAAHPYAMRLDGVDDYVSLAPAFTLNQNSLTAEFWVKISDAIDDTGRADRAYLYGEGAGSASHHRNGIYFTKASTSWAPTSFQYDHYMPSGTDIIAEHFYAPEQWMQVVIVRDGTDGAIYKNGVLDSTYSNVENYSGSAISKTSIGAEINSLSRHYFVGDIGLVRLYDAALCESEIAGNFNSDAVNFGLTPVPEPHAFVLLALALPGFWMLRRHQQ